VASGQVMAPGICAALLTTVVGLLVALPSMLGYNLLVARVRTMIVKLETCMAEISSVFDRHYVDHSGTHAPLPPAVLGLEPTFSSSSTHSAPAQQTTASDHYEQHPMSAPPIMK
jgi:biopolymer transport protein TolQ